jgi:hypothetical protein
MANIGQSGKTPRIGRILVYVFLVPEEGTVSSSQNLEHFLHWNGRIDNMSQVIYISLGT